MEIQLTSLQSIKGDKKNDLYFKFKIDGGEYTTVPAEPTSDHSWELGKTSTVSLDPSSQLQDGTVIDASELNFTFNQQIEISLFDKDNNDDDPLGVITIKSTDSPSSSGLLHYPNSKYSYELYYTLS